MKIALALLVAALPARAHAQAQPGDAGREAADSMRRYFGGETRGGYWLMAMGAAGLGSGAYLLSRGTERARGASYPLLGFGVVHVAAGIFINLTSRGRVRRFEPAIARDLVGWARKEQRRMKGVERQFALLTIIEAVAVVGGVAAAVVGERTDRPLVTGIGVALAVEAAATLLFDIVAKRRARRYRMRLAPLRF